MTIEHEQSLAFRILEALAKDTHHPEGWAARANLPDQQTAPVGYVTLNGDININRIAAIAAMTAADYAAAQGEGDPFVSLDKTAEVVAMLTGVKRQFTDQGWSEAAAESIVMHTVLAGNRAS